MNHFNNIRDTVFCEPLIKWYASIGRVTKPIHHNFRGGIRRQAQKIKLCIMLYATPEADR